jgi:hypothetical protein
MRFAGVAVPGRQWNFRASPAAPDPLTTTVGPLSIKVVEGLRRHRLVLAPNDSGIAFELDFVSDFSPHGEKRTCAGATAGSPRAWRAAQRSAAPAAGCEYDGKRIEVDESTWLGQRDPPGACAPRCAPTRATRRSPSTALPTAGRRRVQGAACLFFKERAPASKIYLSGEEVFRLGEKVSAGTSSPDLTHEVQWHDDRDGQSMASADFHLRFADDRERDVQVRVLPTRVLPQRRLYGGLDGWLR